MKSQETCIFLFIFALSKFSRRASKVHKRGTLPASLKNGVRERAPCAPCSYVHGAIIVFQQRADSTNLELMADRGLELKQKVIEKSL